MHYLLIVLSLVSLLLSGGIFGFFYAWVCSTMWGLDATDPVTAIKAMRAMNASVQNAVFAPIFFATPLVLAITSGLCFMQNMNSSAIAFILAAAIYFFGGMVLTMSVNVPMNQALASAVITDEAIAGKIWANYSAPWQFWNIVRTIFSGIALILTGIGIWLLGLHSNSTVLS